MSATIAWIENEEREDPNPIEKAMAIEKAMERFKWTQASVAERWGLSRSGVANLLRLLKLPDDARGAIQRGEISQRHGRVLLSAMGKSPTIYDRVAAKIVPLPTPAEDVVEKVRELAGQRQYMHIQNLTVKGEQCGACGVVVGQSDSFDFARGYDGGFHYLCMACYRAGTGWTPPSVSLAEKNLQDAVYKCSNRLAQATFPLDVEIGGSSPMAPDLSGEIIRCSKCAGCGCTEEKRDEIWCLDPVCFGEKGALWKAHVRIQFEMQCAVMFGEVPEICAGYGGYDLWANDEADVGLIRDGVCAPGKCERLRFKLTVRVNENGIAPVPEMPFVYNCNHSSSHRACARRYLESQRTEDQAHEERGKKRRASANRKKAAQRLEQVAHVVSKGIFDRDDALWYQLAKRFDPRVKRGRPVDVYVWRIAVALAGEVPKDWDWEESDVLVQFEEIHVDNLLKFLGIKMPATVEDVGSKLERIKGFVLGEDGELRGDLTKEQVEGNLANLEKLTLELGEIQGTSSVSGQDFARLDAEIDNVWEMLRAIVKEKGCGGSLSVSRKH